MSDFYSWMERWLSEQLVSAITKKTPRTALNSFLGFCSDREPSRELLINWIQGWRGSSLTMQNYASAMRRFFDWLGHEGLFQDIGHGLKNYTRQQFEHSHLPLTVKQVGLLLEHLAGYEQPSHRDTCLILLMINCGLRSCEVRRARIGDIYQRDDTKCLRVQGKGHIYPDAYVVLMPHLAELLEFYISVRPGPRGENDPIFTAFTRPYPGIGIQRLSLICRKHLDAIGLLSPRYTAHSLRHTAATIALERGASEEEVSKMLRHVDPRTTRIYTRFVNRMANPAERSLDFKLPDSADRKIIPIAARRNR